MSAIVAVLAGPTAPPAKGSRGWAEATSRLDSRSPGVSSVVESENLLAGYSGSAAAHWDGEALAFLDGGVENLDRLVSKYGLPPREADTTDSQIIASLWRIRSSDIAPELEGSFALAVVDTVRQQVHLARGQRGARPMFFASRAEGWCWASELKCLVPLLDRSTLDTEALGEAFHYRWLLGERTLIDGVRQVAPASLVTLEAGRPPLRQPLRALRFSPEDDGSPSAWRERIDEALDSCMARQAERHPTVAVLLSGGVDSSLLAVKALRAGFERVLAVSARFPGKPNPELEWASRVARHAGVEHRIVDVEDSLVQAYLPELVWRTECPPRHFKSFALHRLLQEVCGEVDAVLDGNAADGLFGSWDMIEVRRQAAVDRIPVSLRRVLKTLAPAGAGGRWAALGGYLGRTVESLIQRHDAVPYATAVSTVVPGLGDEPRPNRDVTERSYASDAPAVERFQGYYLDTHVRNQTEQMDRVSSPFGLEVVEPFLSPEVLDVAVRLPTKLKAGGKEVKVLLKDLATSHFPRPWMYRPKMAFPVPIQDWVVGALEPQMAVLHQERTLERGIFDARALRQLDPQVDYQLLRTCATLEIFLRQFVDGDPEAIPATADES